jgi:hypothetical protein
MNQLVTVFYKARGLSERQETIQIPEYTPSISCKVHLTTDIGLY